jgi:hypothetical protein
MKPLDVLAAYTDAKSGVWPEELPRDRTLSGLASALENVVGTWCRIRSLLG